jgi:hypothetical protein
LILRPGVRLSASSRIFVAEVMYISSTEF